MRVICIDASNHPSNKPSFIGFRKDWHVKEGEVYNVTNQYSDSEYGTTYDLMEDPKGGK